MVEGPPQSAAGTTLRARLTVANGAFLSVTAGPGSNPTEAALDAYTQLAEFLRERRLEIVQERIFGTLDAEATVRSVRGEVFRDHGLDDTPCNYLQGQPAWGDGFGGVLVHALSADDSTGGIQTILDGDEPRGRCWQLGGTRFLLLQDVRGTAGADEDPSPAAQAQRAILRADALLKAHGANYGHTARTWFYLANILDWYGDFNRARTALYRKFGLVAEAQPGRILPASTGIRAGLSGEAACSVDVLAIVGPEKGEPAVRALRNPRQEEAFLYGSSFSRGAAIRVPGETLIQLSGTAAIDERGASLYPENVRAQVRCTLDKVVGVLTQSRACLRDLCSATLFVKRAEDADAVCAEMAAAGLGDLPAVYVVTDVCRDELLFEIDAEAVVPEA